jgi:hypothetical protein
MVSAWEKWYNYNIEQTGSFHIMAYKEEKPFMPANMES